MRKLGAIVLVASALAISSTVASPNGAGSLATVFDPADDEESWGGHRNERSTPRESVLPKTPAIARSKLLNNDADAVRIAKASLLRLGYRVGRLDGRVTARFKAALFRYQRNRGLPSSARLDAATRRSLNIGRP